MSFLSFLGCAINRHRPVRREVEWDGRTYFGRCRHCGAPIARHGRRDWRRRAAEDD
ncbi:hypothetical protein [Erythrobacter cryptus]|uniref:hypothetical protein n=1 Tax=Erythrobacter cryptus TaxID=196588 RepID=UPI0012ECB93E|nr:hypothetical protein [Erythrobacter cryptus]GIX21103.1 MAG: hypothetical protein KatS3mg120_2779 [Erythrobacter sp.]